jgi:osmotically-inducible protein OsmY
MLHQIFKIIYHKLMEEKMKNSLNLKNALGIVSIVLCLGLASCTVCDGRTMGKRIDDTTLLVKVEAAIHNNKKLLHTSAISVNNHGNLIQLSGFVDTQWEKEEAERTAKRVERVEGVINSIVVKNTAHSHIGRATSDLKNAVHNRNK